MVLLYRVQTHHVTSDDFLVSYVTSWLCLCCMVQYCAAILIESINKKESSIKMVTVIWNTCERAGQQVNIDCTCLTSGSLNFFVFYFYFGKKFSSVPFFMVDICRIITEVSEQAIFCITQQQAVCGKRSGRKVCSGSHLGTNRLCYGNFFLTGNKMSNARHAFYQHKMQLRQH